MTKSHEWTKTEDGGIAMIGITSYAAEALGEVVFVDLPEIGSKLKKGQALGAVESVKAAEDVYSPATGTVLEVNDDLTEEPGLVNEDPFRRGWFIKLKLENAKDLDGLLDTAAYDKYCKDSKH